MEARTETETLEEYCLLDCSTWFLIQTMPTCLGGSAATVGNALLHQMLIKEMSPEICPRTVWWRQFPSFPSWHFLSPGYCFVSSSKKKKPNQHRYNDRNMTSTQSLPSPPPSLPSSLLSHPSPQPSSAPHSLPAQRYSVLRNHPQHRQVDDPVRKSKWFSFVCSEVSRNTSSWEALWIIYSSGVI